MQRIMKPLLRRPLIPGLMVMQVALACAIACNALFLLQQKLAPIIAPDGVADPPHLVVLSNIVSKGTPPSAARLRTVEAELRNIPGVKAVTYADSFPMVSMSILTGNLFGKNPLDKVGVVEYTGDNMVDTLGLRIVAGRNFTPVEEAPPEASDADSGGGSPVIITRALADRLFPDGNALGGLIHASDSPDSGDVVVGIVANLMRNELTGDAHALDYTVLYPGWMASWPAATFAARINKADLPEMCKDFMAVLQRNLGTRLLPGKEVRCDTYASLRSQMMAHSRAAVWLLSGVTLVVLIVTMTGIMGMTGYWVQQRTKQIGIKRALGARRGDILRELLIENLFVVGVGAVFGLFAAYGINLWLMRHYELLRLPWTYLPLGAVLLLVLGQLAVFGRARQASNVPPIVATRSV